MEIRHFYLTSFSLCHKMRYTVTCSRLFLWLNKYPHEVLLFCIYSSLLAWGNITLYMTCLLMGCKQKIVDEFFYMDKNKHMWLHAKVTHLHDCKPHSDNIRYKWGTFSATLCTTWVHIIIYEGHALASSHQPICVAIQKIPFSLAPLTYVTNKRVKWCLWFWTLLPIFNILQTFYSPLDSWASPYFLRPLSTHS
jgi:hypothetical protein